MSYQAHKTAIVDAGAETGAGTRIGEDCFIGAGAVITHDVKPYALMTGVPAQPLGWMSHHGERLDLPLTGHGEAKCPATGERYRLNGDTLERLDGTTP